MPASENQGGLNSCNSVNSSKGTKRIVRILTEMTAKSKGNPAEIITFHYPNILTRCFTNYVLDLGFILLRFGEKDANIRGRIYLPISPYSGVSFIVVLLYSTFGFPNETGCVLDG